MPEAIFLTVLNNVTDGYLKSDLNLLRENVRLPLTMDSQSGEYHIETDGDLKADFALYQNSLGLHGVTDIIRQLNDVEAVGNNTIRGTYTTHIMRRAERIVDPYQSTMTVTLADDGWRATRVQNCIGHLNWTTGGAARR